MTFLFGFVTRHTLCLSLIVWTLACFSVGTALADQTSTCQSPSPPRAQLEQAKSYIEASGAPIHSMLVLHCGDLIFEDYRLGYDSIMPHDLQSATKTYSMLLIGALIEEERIESVDVPIKALLPRYAHLLQGDKEKITLHHVLSMTSGLAWKDFGRGNSFERIINAADSVTFILSEPLVSEPGETFFYNTGSSHLLSAIVTAVTGKPALAYADERLFTPMEMMDYEWDAFSDGRSLGGWGLYKRPRDMAKIGQMILDGGYWKGRKLIEPDFVTAATRKQAGTNGGVGGNGYGYQMWIPNGLDHADVAAAIGFGGQSIYVFDDLDLVVVFTASVEKPVKNAAVINDVLQKFIAPNPAEPADSKD